MASSKRADAIEQEVGLVTEPRFLILGVNNPKSMNPRFALHPAPAGCAGARLMAMMQEADPTFALRDYMRIPRANLFPLASSADRKFTKEDFETAGRLVLYQVKYSGATIVCLGHELFQAVTHAGGKLPPMKKIELHGCAFSYVPHPSGKNLYYNSRTNRLKVGRYLTSLWRELT